MCIHNVKIDMDDMVRRNVYRTIFEIIDIISIILNVKPLENMKYEFAFSKECCVTAWFTNENTSFYVIYNI